jgi:hypothetical protein
MRPTQKEKRAAAPLCVLQSGCIQHAGTQSRKYCTCGHIEVHNQYLSRQHAQCPGTDCRVHLVVTQADQGPTTQVARDAGQGTRLQGRDTGGLSSCVHHSVGHQQRTGAQPIPLLGPNIAWNVSAQAKVRARTSKHTTTLHDVTSDTMRCTLGPIENDRKVSPLQSIAPT